MRRRDTWVEFIYECEIAVSQAGDNASHHLKLVLAYFFFSQPLSRSQIPDVSAQAKGPTRNQWTLAENRFEENVQRTHVQCGGGGSNRKPGLRGYIQSGRCIHVCSIALGVV